MKSFGFTEKDLGRFQSDRKSYLCIPALKRGDQKVLAVVSFDSNSDGTFTPDMIKEIERITSYISDVIQGGLS